MESLIGYAFSRRSKVVRFEREIKEDFGMGSQDAQSVASVKNNMSHKVPSRAPWNASADMLNAGSNCN